MTTRALTGLDTPVTLDPAVWTRLQELAESAGRSVSELAGAVLRDFVDENDRHLAAIDVGIAAADAGELIDFEEVEADVHKQLAALSARR
jgi:predicted transcriptional regulator